VTPAEDLAAYARRRAVETTTAQGLPLEPDADVLDVIAALVAAGEVGSDAAA
jgi:hypothetical protein